MTHWLGAFDDYSFETPEMIDGGNDVFVVMLERGIGKGSGVKVEQRFAPVWTFRNGKVVRYRGFRDEAEARMAAGLRE